MARSLVTFLALSSFLFHITFAFPLIPRNASAGCKALATIYPNLTSFPADAEYSASVPDNWSETCVLAPYCLFEPEQPEHVSAAVKIMRATNTAFAVRGGGHMPVPYAANINGGVLISLDQFTTMQLSSDQKTVMLGPGLRWGAVYTYVSQYGLAVVGGRYDPVGVPGLLLGGGINYFGSLYGWAANSVVNMQVVLADGSIVYANTNESADLFWALKGGSSNFGIVTRFDVKTFPLGDIYGGTSLYNPAYIQEFVDAIGEYVVPEGGSGDTMASCNPSIQVNVSTGAITLLSIVSHIGSDPAPAALANFTNIPTLFTDNSVRPNLAGFTVETSLAVYSSRSSRQLFWSTALKATRESVYLANQTFFETLASMPELQSVAGLLLTSTHQTITKSWLKAAQASGDAIDLDPAKGPIIAFLISSSWQNAADDALVNEFSTRCVAAIKQKSTAAGLYYPFVYLNDAGGSENPFALYGGGASLPKMKQIRGKYDPAGVFQTLMPGGFKLGFY